MKLKLLPIVFLFASVLLVPGSALGNSVNDIEEQQPDVYSDGNKLEPDFEDLPHPMQHNIDTNETVLEAEKMISKEMARAAESEFDVVSVPFTSVGKSGDTLQVGIHPFALEAGIQYTDKDIQQLLNTDAQIQIDFVQPVFENRDSMPQTFEEEYFWYCIPPLPGFYEVCKQMSNSHDEIFVLTPEQYDQLYFSTPVPESELLEVPESSRIVDPNSCRSPTQSTACYYVDKWQRQCTPTTTSDRACMSIWGVFNIFKVDKSKLTPPGVSDRTSYVISGLAASLESDGDVLISWSNPSFSVTYYKVYYKSSTASSYSELNRAYSNSYTVDDRLLQAGKSYTFMVKGYIGKTNPATGNYFTAEAVSNSVSIPRDTAPPPPPRPTTVKDVTDQYFRQTNTVNIPIPDNTDSLDVRNSINVPSGTIIDDISVKVNIKHTYKGDLKVILDTPHGQIILHNRSGGGTDNIVKTFSGSTFSKVLNKDAGGTWKLLVGDYGGGDTGKLVSWGIDIDKSTVNYIITGFDATYNPDDNTIKLSWDRPSFPIKEHRLYVSVDDSYKKRIPNIDSSDQHTYNNAQPGSTYEFELRTKLNHKVPGTSSTYIKPYNIATVDVPVPTPVNTAPVAVNDSYTTLQNNTLSITASNGVLANDSDAENDPLLVTANTAPSHGTLDISSDGSFTFVPSNNIGPATFSYTVSDGQDTATATVTITVQEPPNTPPVAVTDFYEATQNLPLVVDAAAGVLSNDSDVDNNPLRASVVERPTHGTLSLASDGSFTYVPNDDHLGSDSFTYRVSDGEDSDTETVELDVYRPVYGGQSLRFSYDHPSFANGTSKLGTISLITEHNNDKVLVSAAHTFALKDLRLDVPLADNQVNGTTTSMRIDAHNIITLSNSLPVSGLDINKTAIINGEDRTFDFGGVDAAYVVLNDQNYHTMKVVFHNGTVINITDTISKDDLFTTGSDVASLDLYLLGRNHNEPGTLENFRSSVIFDPEEWGGFSLYLEDIFGADYESKGGDSGGPVITVPVDGNASLVGIHVTSYGGFVSWDDATRALFGN